MKKENLQPITRLEHGFNGIVGDLYAIVQSQLCHRPTPMVVANKESFDACISYLCFT